MTDDNKRKVLYDQLTSDGYDLGSFDSFSSKLDDPKKRRVLYDAVTNDGYDVGDYDTFSGKLDGATGGGGADGIRAEETGRAAGGGGTEETGRAAGEPSQGYTFTRDELEQAEQRETQRSALKDALTGSALAAGAATAGLGRAKRAEGTSGADARDTQQGHGDVQPSPYSYEALSTGAAESGALLEARRQQDEERRQQDEEREAAAEAERAREAAAEEEYRRQQKEAFEANGGRERLEEIERRADEALSQNSAVQAGRLIQRGAQLMPGAMGKGLAWGVGKFMEALGALTDGDSADAMTAKRKVEETKAMLDEAGHAENGWFDRQIGGVWRGMVGTLLDVNTWDFGLRDAVNAFNVAGVAQKADAGEQLTPSEQMLLDAMMLSSVAEQGYKDDISMGYQAGEVAGYSAGFAASLALNPASGIGQGLQAGAKATTQAAMREMVKRYGINGARRFMMAAKPFGVIGEKAGSIVARGAGDLAEAAVATGSVQLPRWMQNFGERVAGQTQAYYDENGQLQYAGQEGAEKDVLDALAKSFGSTYIENASEMVGEWLPFGKIDDLAKPIAKDAERGIMRFGRKEGRNGVERLTLHPEDFTPSQWSQAVRALRQKAHFGGLVSEYLEEVIGNFANAATVGDNNFNHWSNPNSVFNPEQNLLTFLGVAVGVGQTKAIESGIPAVMRQVGNYYSDRELNKAYRDLQAAYGDDFGELEVTINQLQTGEIEDAAASLREALRPENVKTVKRAQALLNFAKQVKVSQGVTTMLTQMQQDYSDSEGMAHSAYLGGLSAPREYWRDAYQEYEAADRQAQETFDDAGYGALQEAVGGNTPAALRRQFFEGLDEQQQEAAEALFYNRRRIDGILAQGENQVEDEVENAVRAARLSEKDGMVQTAAYNGGMVFVAEQTGNSAMVIDPMTSERSFVPLSQLTMLQSTPIGTWIDEQEQEATRLIDSETNWALQHRPETRPGAVGLEIPLRGSDGTQGAQVIVGQNDDGTWQVAPAKYDPVAGQWVPQASESLTAMSEDDVLAAQDAYYDGVQTGAEEGEEEGTEGADGTDGIREEETERAETGENAGGEAPAEEAAGENAGGEAPAEEAAGENAGGEVPAAAAEVENAGGEAPAEEAAGENAGAEMSAAAATGENAGDTIDSRYEDGDFSGGTAEDAAGWLFDEERSGFEGEKADDYVRMRQDEARKALSKTEGKEPKIKAGMTPRQYKQQKTEWQQQVQAARDEVRFWEDVKGLRDRQTGRDLLDDDARFTQEMQQAVNEAEGNREAMRRLSEVDPETLDEIAADMLANGTRVMWQDEERDGARVRGAASHTGYNRSDVSRMPFLFASGERGGLSVDAFGEAVLQEARDRGVRYDEDDAMAGVNALLDVLGSVRTQGDVNNYIARNRIRDAREILRQDEIAREEFEREEAARRAAEQQGSEMGVAPVAPSAEEQEAIEAGVAEQAAGREAARREGEALRGEEMAELEEGADGIRAEETGRSGGEAMPGATEARPAGGEEGTREAATEPRPTENEERTRGAATEPRPTENEERTRGAATEPRPTENEERTRGVATEPRSTENEGGQQVQQPSEMLVSDERMEELKRRLRAKFRGQMNVGVDPEMLALGTELAVGYIERGVRRFVDYARVMIADLGDVVRPYLKAFYNGAREMPEAEPYAGEMTPYDEVRQIDVANFDKAVPDVLDQVNMQGDEQKVDASVRSLPVVNTEKRERYESGQHVVIDSEGTGRVYTVEYVTEEGDVIPGRENSFIRYYHLKERPYQRYTGDQLSLAVQEGRADVKKTQEIAAGVGRNKKNGVSLQQEPDLFSQASGSEEGGAREAATEARPTENEEGTRVAATEPRPTENEEGALGAATEARPTENEGDTRGAATEPRPTENEELYKRLTKEERAQNDFVNEVALTLMSAVNDDAWPAGERPIKSIKDLRRMAREEGMYVDEDGRSDILLQELTEAALVRAARLLTMSRRYDGRTGRKTFQAIKKLYELQPTIAQRSGNRIRLQQYSTPLPMSFVADMFAYREGMENVLEPTAGNGMLVFAVPAAKIHANELDETRRGILERQGYKRVTGDDATGVIGADGIRAEETGRTETERAETRRRGGVYDSLITNPPFGSSAAKEYDGVMISGLEQQIALTQLAQVKDDGTAAIIIGGNTEYAPNGSLKGGYRDFLCYLYDHYNVAGVADMAGDLYSRQGTSYPTRMILINGRRSEAERAQTTVYPPVRDKAIKRVDTFDELYDVVLGLKNSNNKTNGTEILRTQELPLAGGQRHEWQSNGDRPNVESNANAGDERGGSGREGSVQDTGRYGAGTVRGTTATSGSTAVRPGNAGVSGPGERESGSTAVPRGGRGETDGLPGRNGLGELPAVGNAGGGVRLNERAEGGTAADAAGTVAGREEGAAAGREEEAAGTVKGATVVQQRTQQEKREIGDEKLPYRRHNGAFSLESLAPAAMVEAMDESLKKIEAEVGNIDDFVTKELGYPSVEAMHNALAAEQVDSVAMAIYQMKQGQALIIGDQTGVGKGRQMAALIRWAVKQGKKPVFITQKAGLFTDIYRDLVDVGSGHLRPFIVNSYINPKKDEFGKDVRDERSGEMLDEKGNLVYRAMNDGAQKKVMERVVNGESLDDALDGFDYVVLTYSQVNKGDAQSRKEAKEVAKKAGKRVQGKKDSDKAEENPLKAAFVRKVANDSYMFMDESHTAAGESNSGAYLQSLLKDVKGATFASATFAKRPDTMPLYALRTAMSKAKLGVDELISAIQKGGVTLQEIMSRALTAAGQMVRRERDMNGVKTDWTTISDPATVQRARENYDKTIDAFNSIIEFQEDFVKPFIEQTGKTLAVTMSNAGVKQGTNKLGIGNVPFASKTYNYTKQLMLALKANAIVDAVDAEIKAGRHPVIALESTMESSYKDFAVGDEIEEPTFAMSLLRGLDSVMQYSVKSGKSETHYPIQPHELGEDGEQAYYELHDKIRAMTGDVFISPLDLIIDGLRAKGYRVGELTGRNTYVERTADGNAVVRRRTDKDKKQMQRDFNSGELDVLILNKSASTGISLHASSRFADQRQRSMIIAQPLSDINDYMQMIGRIDRTGQVARGYYINLGLPVPAEQRFLMMLSTKLKSLNANTTTSQDNESNDVDAPDLLNKYGSQVVVEYLRDNPEVYEQMGEPLKNNNAPVDAKDLDSYQPSSDESDARKITGYVALLPTAQQEEFYNDVIRRYTELIHYLDETDSNDLKITVMPLRAETLEKGVSSEGVDADGENPFGRDAYWERVMVDVLRKPMKVSEVRKTIEQLNGSWPTADTEGTVAGGVEALKGRVRSEAEEKLRKEEERFQKALQTFEEGLAKRREKIMANEKMTDEEKRKAIDDFERDGREKLTSKNSENEKKIEDARDSLLRNLDRFKVGESYLVPDDLTKQTFMFASPAIFCGFKAKDTGVTPSTTFAVFATLDGRRKVELKLSEATPLAMIGEHTWQNYDTAKRTTLDNWDASIPSSARKEAYILTGNILQAIVDSNYTGHLITFTDIDGNVRDGILMPQGWTPTQLKSSGVPINTRLEDARAGKTLYSIDGDVVVGRSGPNTYTITVPSSKKAGGRYFQDEDLIRLVNYGDFYPHHGKLRADFFAGQLEGVLNVLAGLGVRAKSAREERPAADAEGTGAGRDAQQGGVRFRQVDDAETIARLEAEPKMTLYRSMVEIDGKLYPPMSSKEGAALRAPSELGVWEQSDEAPEKAVLKNGRWVFPLKKDNGKSLFAAYNPYFHSSRTMLNDQFSEAQSRGNLVVVEVEVPMSELTSGYQAERAKDSVGMKEWKAGPLQGKLSGTREVMLSRWAKPVRVVPTDEVADNIATMIAGQIDVMPSNVVAPQLRAALETRGIAFVETDNRGKITEGEHKGETWSQAYGQKAPTDVKEAVEEGSLADAALNRGGAGVQEMDAAVGRLTGKSARQRAAYTSRERERARRAGERLAEKLRVQDRVTFVETGDEVTDEMLGNMTTRQKAAARKQRAWYDPKTGKMIVIVGNHKNTDDVLRSILHEAVAHHGLRELFGNDFRTFLSNVYNNVSPELRDRILALAEKNGWDIDTATEEYLASLAEDTDFERAMAQGWWYKIKNLFIELLRKAGIMLGEQLTDADLRYILWRSYNNLAHPRLMPMRDILDEAEDISTQRRLGVRRFGSAADAVGAVAEKVDADAPDTVIEKVDADAPGTAAGALFREGDEDGVLFRDGDEIGAEAFGGGAAGDAARAIGVARATYERALGRLSTRIKEIAQDKWQSVLEGVRAIEKAIGAKVKDYENPYFAANLNNSVAAKAREDFERNEAKALLTEVGKAQEAIGIDAEDLERYAYAKHALERNRVFAFRDTLNHMRDAYRGATGNSVDEVYDEYNNDPAKSSNDALIRIARQRYLSGDITLDEYYEAYEKWAREDDRLRAAALDKAGEKLPIKYRAGDAYKKRREKDYSGIGWLAASEEAEESAAPADKPTLADLERLAFELAAQREKTAADNDYDVDDLWRAVKAVSDFGLRQNYEGGLINEKTYDYVRGMFDYYVPLQGWDEATAEDVYVYSSEAAQSPSGTLRSARGRKSEAAHTLGTLISQADAAISVSYRNRMKQSLLALAENHPTDLLSVSRLWYKWDATTERYEVVDYASAVGINDSDSPDVVRQKYADFEQRMRDEQRKDAEQRAILAAAGTPTNDPPLYATGGERPDIGYRISQRRLGEHQVVVKRGGIDYVVTVNGNPRMAQAINGKLSSHDDSIVKQTFRTISAWQTSLNPNFVVPNAARDIGFGLATSLAREGGDYARRYARHIASDSRHMIGLVWCYQKGRLDMSNARDRAFKEFMAAGGETSYKGNHSIDEYVKAIRQSARKLRDHKGVRHYTVEVGRDIISGYLGGVEFLARVSELMTRFAAYQASREVGRSVTRSIYDAKQISANFDKKGSGKMLVDKSKDGRLLYYFSHVVSVMQDMTPYFNAAMQGFASTMDSIYGGYDRNAGSGTRAAAVGASIFVHGLVVAPMAYALYYAISSGLSGGDGDDDDDKGLDKSFDKRFAEGISKYYEHPFYDREKNIVLPFSLKMPLAPEVRGVYGTGDIFGERIYRAAVGRYTNDRRMTWRMVKQLSELTPVNAAEIAEGGRGILPIPLATLYDVMMNESWSGRRIYKERYGDTTKAGYELAYDQDALLTRVAKTLNNASRGSLQHRGLFSIINPAAIDYGLRQNLGGMYQVPVQAFTLSRKALGGNFTSEVEARDIPILNRFWSRVDGRDRQRLIDEEFYDNKEIMDDFAAEVKSKEKEKDYAAVSQLKSSEMWKDYQAWKRFEKEVKKYRDDERLEYLYKEWANQQLKE